MNHKNIYISAALVLFIVLARVLPHVPNFAPVAAATLAAGVYAGKKWALIVPLVGMFLSDVLVGFYHWQVMLAVYASFGLIALLSWYVRRHKHPVTVVAATLWGSLFFFLITNTAVWLTADWYERSWSGLLYCFQLALPFFRYTLAGDMGYVLLIFGVFELSQAVYRQRQLATGR